MASLIDLEGIRWNSDGLIPAIVQDNQSKSVLMLAYMNKEALEKTLATKEAWFWSRSRAALWHKGATSGNIQQVVELKLDCDRDTILLFVKPQGPACHNGTYTCFEESIQKNGTCLHSSNILLQLSEVIAKRELERPEGAYTTYLFHKGLDKILKKVGEEASEVIIAAKNRDLEELSNESADLLYHLLVLWREQGLPLEGILDVLRQRSEK